jgi:hypothetical protein
MSPATADVRTDEEEQTGYQAQGEEEMKTTNGLLSLGAIFALMMVFSASSNAFGFDHHGHDDHHDGWHGGGFYGGSVGFVVAPRPAGYYQTVTETVMVQAESVQQYWVPPVYNTVTDASGNPQTVLVRDGYMAQRIIPAQYTTVTRQVWVPCGGPSVGVGFGFRF